MVFGAFIKIIKFKRSDPSAYQHFVIWQSVFVDKIFRTGFI